MHTLVSCLLHCVFATKERAPILTAEVRARLWPYLGGLAREHGLKALAVGGVEDHVHLLLSLSATMPIAKAMQVIKGNSSKWLHETFPMVGDVGWQEGYGAFSIGASGIDDTVAYIRNQEERHRTRTFAEEVEVFVKRHGMTFDPRMLGGGSVVPAGLATGGTATQD